MVPPEPPAKSKSRRISFTQVYSMYNSPPINAPKSSQWAASNQLFIFHTSPRQVLHIQCGGHSRGIEAARREVDKSSHRCCCWCCSTGANGDETAKKKINNVSFYRASHLAYWSVADGPQHHRAYQARSQRISLSVTINRYGTCDNGRAK